MFYYSIGSNSNKYSISSSSSSFISSYYFCSNSSNYIMDLIRRLVVLFLEGIFCKD